MIIPKPWEEGMCSGVTHRNEHSTVSYCLRVDQLLVSVLITIHFQKFLWWELRDLHIYGYSDKLLWVGTILCPFRRTIKVGPALGPVTYLATGSWAKIMPGMSSILWNGPYIRLEIKSPVPGIVGQWGSIDTKTSQHIASVLCYPPYFTIRPWYYR